MWKKKNDPCSPQVSGGNSASGLGWPIFSGSGSITPISTPSKPSQTNPVKPIMQKNFDSEALIKKLEFYFDQNYNVHLMGEKGVGKSTIISAVLNAKCKKWLYFSAATLDPFCDFVGVPKEVTKNGEQILSFIRPEYMTDDIEAIFLDEFNRSAKKVRNACMELIQFKSINGRKFPNLKVVWIGTNPFNPDDDAEDVYDVEPLDPAQADRFQIQIEIPYAPDHNYFEKKYGAEIAAGAFEWWWGLPPKTKKTVSPRRLDYVLEVYKAGGDIKDVVSKDSNPSKLLGCLKTGGVQKKLKQIFEAKDVAEAKKFLENENQYQASVPAIIDGPEDFAKFFYDLIDEERQISMFFSSEKLQKFVMRNSLKFKDLLGVIAKNPLCQGDLHKTVEFEVKRLKGVEAQKFNSDPSGIDWSSMFKSQIKYQNTNLCSEIFLPKEEK